MTTDDAARYLEQAWIRFAAAALAYGPSVSAAASADRLLDEFRRRRDSGAFGPRGDK